MNPTESQDRLNLITKLGISELSETEQTEQLAILDEVLVTRILNKIPDWLSPEQMQKLDAMPGASGDELQEYLQANIADYEQKIRDLVEATIDELVANRKAVEMHVQADTLEDAPE